MYKIVFDIETQNSWFDTGIKDPTSLDISLLAIYDYTTDQYSSFLEDELNKLWPILEKADMLIGFNSDGFDIPLLNKYYSGDLNKIKSLDLLTEIRKSIGRRVSLQKVAQGTLGENKSGNGLEAITWWRNGEIEKVRQYCIQDVKVTKKIYDYAIKNNGLKYREDGKITKFNIDTSKWEESDKDSGLHPTLGF
jgi:DEAD/DEAH box helicase domain-containing protein